VSLREIGVLKWWTPEGMGMRWSEREEGEEEVEEEGEDMLGEKKNLAQYTIYEKGKILLLFFLSKVGMRAYIQKGVCNNNRGSATITEP